MPTLGTLILSNNILVVKFNDEFTDQVAIIPEKLALTKKHINLNSEISQNNYSKKDAPLKNLPEVAKNLSQLRPKT
jgi:hypothetical protein